MYPKCNVVIRAFNAEGYHRDLVIMDEVQVRMNHMKIKEPIDSMYSRLIGVGVSIDPKDFPEMVKFEVVIEAQR